MKVKDYVKSLVPVWQDLNCFDSPTLMVEIRRLVAKVVQEDGTKLDATAATTATIDDIATVDVSTSNQDTITEQIEEKAEKQHEDEDHVVDFDVTNDAEELETSTDGTGANLEIPVGSGLNEPMVGSDMEDHAQNEDEEMTDANNSALDAPRSTSSSPIPALAPASTLEIVTAPDNDIDGQNPNKAKKDAPKEKEFDFENQGIAEEKVAVRELVPSCTSIATMQITRDLRNDSSHNLSTVLASVPMVVLDGCRKAREGDGVVDLKGLPVIPDEVLDLDVAGALANVRLHREVIKKQKELKRKCIELLIKSRCKFGSAEAAEMFYTFDDITDKLKKRKALILDAMELEGLDFEAMDGNGGNAGEEEKLSDFTWLMREDANNKKLRTE